MSSSRQEALSTLPERILALPPVIELQPDTRTRRAHYDWLEAGEHAQRTIAQLSQQLRRFLDNQAWLENRRIMDILPPTQAANREGKKRNWPTRFWRRAWPISSASNGAPSAPARFASW